MHDDHDIKIALFGINDTERTEITIFCENNNIAKPTDISASRILIVGSDVFEDSIAANAAIFADKIVIQVLGNQFEQKFKALNACTTYVLIAEKENIGAAISKASHLAQHLCGDNHYYSEITQKITHRDFDTMICRVRAVLDLLPLGVLFVKNRSTVSANKIAKQLLDISLTENFDTIQEIFSKNFLDVTFNDFVTQLDSDKEIRTFVVHRSKAITIALFGRRIEHSDEYLFLLEDITETARKSEWLESLLSAIGDGVLVTDPQRKIVWVNQQMREWFGNELCAENTFCYRIWGDGKNICPQCALDRVYENGEIYRYIERILSGSGEERFYEVTAAPIRGIHGEVYQIVQIARDITTRELNMRELLETRRNLVDVHQEIQKQYTALRTILEITDTLQKVSALDKILHIILTAVTAREGLGFNRAFLFLVNDDEQMLEGKYAIGPSSREEAGRIWNSLASKATTLAETLDLYREATQSEDTLVNKLVRRFKIPLSSEHFLVRSMNAGSPVAVSPDIPELFEQAHDLREGLGVDRMGLVPLLSTTQPVGIIVVDNLMNEGPIYPENLEFLRSIASHASLAIERSFLNEELMMNHQKLEQAYEKLRINQEKLVEAERLSTIGAMAAQVAHEIRNPLVSIGGFAQSMLDSMTEEDEHVFAVKIIIEETKRLEGIVTDVLGYSRLSEPHFQIADIALTIFDTLILFEPEFEENGVKIEVFTDESLPAFRFDPNQLRQVFINFIRNSLGALGEGGIISIRAKRDGSYCWLEFSDNGPGIPAELGEKIFQPFFTTRTSGTGLGLAISQRIIESHSGNIWYKNFPNNGVTFFVRIPLITTL